MKPGFHLASLQYSTHCLYPPLHSPQYDQISVCPNLLCVKAQLKYLSSTKPFLILEQKVTFLPGNYIFLPVLNWGLLKSETYIWFMFLYCSAECPTCNRHSMMFDGQLARWIIDGWMKKWMIEWITRKLFILEACAYNILILSLQLVCSYFL